MPLVMLILLWLLGIMLADYLHPALVPLLIGTGTTFSLAAVWRASAWGTLLLGLGMVLIGASRFAWAQPRPTATGIEHYIGEWVMLRGTIAAQPDRREDRQTAVLAQIIVMRHGRLEPSPGQILLQLPPVPELDYGMQLEASGMLIQPPTTPSFDYRAYLQRRGVALQ